MTTGLTIIYTSLLYYCCLLLLARYILNCVPRKLIFVPLTVFVLSDTTSLIYSAYAIFQIIQFVLIKITFGDIKIRHVLFFYIVLYSVNILLTSLLVAFIPQHFKYLDICINTIITALWTCLCLSQMRYIIQQILDALPKHIMVISAVLLVIATLISAIISHFQYGDFPEVWNRWIQLFTSFLLMAICLVVPVIFIISISNTRLKTLTADYEQQIHQ